MSSETKAANPGKKKEGFLKRQAKQSKAASEVTVTEDELLQKDFVTPEDVLRLNKGTESKYIFNLCVCEWLCPSIRKLSRFRKFHPIPWPLFGLRIASLHSSSFSFFSSSFLFCFKAIRGCIYAVKVVLILSVLFIFFFLD